MNRPSPDICAARRRERGVTAVELMIVVSVISILAMIALPRIGLGRFQVNSAMRGIGTMLQGAQRTAIVRSHDVVVGFDTSDSMAEIHYDRDNDGERDAGERVARVPLGDGVVIGRGAAPARRSGDAVVTFEAVRAGNPAVTFHRNGSASESGSLYLTSARSAANPEEYTGETREIEIVRATGRVGWYRHNGHSWDRGF